MSENAKVAKSLKVVQLDKAARSTREGDQAVFSGVLRLIYDTSSHFVAARIRQFFDSVDDSLFEFADKVASNQEQNLYFDAMRELRVRRQGIEKNMGLALETAFLQLVASADIPEDITGNDSQTRLDDSQDVATPQTRETLWPREDEELELIVAMQSAVSRANTEYVTSLQLISLRLDTLVAKRVSVANNPLSPEFLCTAFIHDIKQLDLDIKAKLILFKLFDDMVICEFAGLYQSLNQMFIDHHVLPSLNIANTSRTQDIKTLAGRSFAHHGTAVKPRIQQENGSLDTTLENFLGEKFSRSAGNHSLALLDLVNGLSNKQRELAGRHDQKVNLIDIAERLDRQLRLQLPEAEHRLIELMSKVFDCMLRDDHLPQPMRALFAALQIPLAKVALLDTAFLTHHGHPARRLLNQMAQAAMGWSEHHQKSDQLLRSIAHVVTRLSEEFDTDMRLFEKLSVEFEAHLRSEQTRSALLEKRLLDMEDGRARAAMARNIVAAEIELRCVDKVLPPAVHKLIHEAWFSVLFVTGVRYGFESYESLSALTTLEDLIWSVQQPKLPAEKRQLVKLVPELNSRLREKMDTIAYDPSVMAAMFKALERVHIACIRDDQAVFGAAGAGGGAIAPSDGEAQPSASSGAALSHTAGQQPSYPVGSVDLLAGPGAKEGVDQRAMRQVAGFAPGAWFEFELGSGDLIRCRLAAILRQTGQYIFTNREGMKAAEKSRLELAVALQQGTLRSLDNTPLFDRAMQTVLAGLRPAQ